MGLPAIDFWLLAVTAATVVVDVLSGVVKGAKLGTLSSSKGREGLYHKSTYVFVLAMAWLLELGQMHADLGFVMPLVAPACVYIILTETMSIVENVSEINPELKGSRLLGLFHSSKDADEG